jgi:predicted nucleic acid-binding Zn ribbon protein
MNKTTTTPEDLKRAFASIGLIYKGSQFGQAAMMSSTVA